MPALVRIDAFIGGLADTALRTWREAEPWSLTASAATVTRSLLETLSADVYRIDGEVAVHRSAEVEAGVTLKGPCIVGAESFVASGAYLRGGVWIDCRCVVGPGAEVKSSFLFAGTALAHFNFVGDSLVGRNVNLEAGSLLANCRNERSSGRIAVRVGSKLHELPIRKFGAIVGDGTRIGANAVVAPGALLPPATIVERLHILDQEKSL
ncbi:LbetaH domain-containing protein [Algihabitans albus]|uniref:LpxA family transferase n=1 Tax=Algihabitans albus TaxID=2164067 RepID=UPI000E5D13D8|nr:LpxA family transferase [Algihabitans albus]